MTRASPEDFIHLFERINEPLGYGMRGGGGGSRDQMIYYYYEDDKMMDTMFESDMMKETVKMVQSRMLESSQRRSGMNVKMRPVPAMPERMPDLSLINDLCPKYSNFSYFVPPHRQAFSMLKAIFMQQQDRDSLFRMACACRDNPMVNCQLFVYALSSCLVSHPATQDIRIPSHCEVSPENYCKSDVIRQAYKMARMSELMTSGDGKPNSKKLSAPKLMIDQNLTGLGRDIEQRLWYFREDILVNSHHFHWHIVYPVCSPKDPSKPGFRDRRGELFYYMHHSMIARYDTERLCNGLPRARKFDFANLTIEEGYFGKLTSENSQQQWGTRQAHTKLANIHRPDFEIKVEQLIRWRDRILESIDIGYYVGKDPKTGKDTRIKLDEFTGIDILGDMLESSASLTPHTQYYGAAGFHNMGHVLIAFSNDPRGKHKEGGGVMSDVATAMRDPAFYRWHKYIDHLFDLYKQTLPPYPLKDDGKSKFPLVWEGMEIVEFHVMARDTSVQENELKTFWDYKDVDLSRGLDFRKSAVVDAKRAPVMARFTHLNHVPFDYIMEVRNNTGKPRLATIRIFMAPTKDESGIPFKLSEQRLLFFEMDKVAYEIKPGLNKIKLSSTNSSVTLKDEEGSSFKNLETLYLEAKSRTDVVNGAQCSCGWPQHLLLPKGSTGGTEYDLFAILTDGSKDNLLNVDRSTGCNSALSFCGVLNKKYPDARPMGYPFDRLPYNVKAMPNSNLLEQCPDEEVPVPTLERYVKDINNAASVKVKIIHEMRMNQKKNDGDVMNEQVMSPDGKCIQLKDYYPNQEQQKGERYPPKGPPRDWPRPRPGPPGQENIPAEERWGFVGRGRRPPPYGRKGRQDDLDDEDWEHLEEEYGPY